jgi:hypothetical protein
MMADEKVEKQAPVQKAAETTSKKPKASLLAAIRIRGEEGVRVDINDALNSLPSSQEAHLCPL